MSSTHLRLEGPALPSLLDQVRAEYGPGARVVHAERIRRGGVGGFFARERYHLEVEVHEGAAGQGGVPATARLPSGPTARTVMDLVEQLNQEEHVAHQRHAGTPGSCPGGAAPASWVAGSGSQQAPTLLAALTSAAAGGTAPMSTESASFADVWSRLQHSVAGDPALVAPPLAAAVPTPVADHVAVPDEPPTFVRLGADPWAAPRSASKVRQRPVGHPPRTAAEQRWTVPGQPIASGQPIAYGQPTGPGQPTASAQPMVGVHPMASEPRVIPHRPDVGQHAVAAQEHSRPHAAPRPTGRSGLHLDETAALVARATRLGVPAHVLEDASDGPTVYRRLLSWVESRPPAPLMAPAPGQVIAVGGELAAAMRVARTLSFELGVDPSRIHLAVPATSSGHDVPVGQLLSDPADIAVRRHRWRQSTGSTIVVVEAALPPAVRAWVGSVVSALAPTFTWAVAQASTKVADVVSWAEVIGEVDAVALENVPATGDPAASLAGPLPIGLLDGRRASVSRWMAMLTMEGAWR